MNTPSIKALILTTRAAAKMAIRACDRMLRIIGTRISCLWKSAKQARFKASPVIEPTSSAPQGVKTIYPPIEGDITDYRLDRMRKNVEQEIKQEVLFHDTLTIIAGNKINKN